MARFSGVEECKPPSKRIAKKGRAWYTVSAMKRCLCLIVYFKMEGVAMNSMIQDFIARNKDSMLQTLKELCLIPAPSHYEHERAKYCKAWLEKIGAQGVYIDDAQNTIFPLNCESSNQITVFAAHLDTVFPDREPLPYYDDGEKIHCPGCSDDTASVVVLLFMAKFFLENHIQPKHGLMFVCDAGEEGLGNLKGMRQLFTDYEGRVAQFVTMEPGFSAIGIGAVGSHRYNVEVLTEGGHSFSAFGNNNAIEKLSKMVADIYAIDVPKIEDSKTTYNVGIINGGTSVNTIAQKASMLCEYRSSDADCLKIMEEKFQAIFENARTDKVQVNVEKVGDRPCSKKGINNMKLANTACSILTQIMDIQPRFVSGSTDANIPLSLGVPAIRIGVAKNANTHRRDEWVEKDSLMLGLEYAIKLGLELKEDVV